MLIDPWIITDVELPDGEAEHAEIGYGLLVLDRHGHQIVMTMDAAGHQRDSATV